MRFKVTRKTVFQWIMINIGTILLAAGVYLFKGPNNFATGGVSGIAILISKFTAPRVSWLGQTNIMTFLNVLLLLIGFIFLGRGCTFKTAYVTLVYTGEMQLMKFIPVTLPMTDEVFLEFVYAMVLTSAGSAIVFHCGASSGGTDIIALIVKKYTNVKDVGKALLLTDFIIAASTFFIFGIQTGLYSILGLFMKAFLVDGVIESIGRNKFVQIITSKPEVITKFILEEIHRGYTSYKARGGYTGEEKTVIITVCKHGEALKLKLKIKKAEPSSFVILTDAKEIIGRYRDTV